MRNITRTGKKGKTDRALVRWPEDTRLIKTRKCRWSDAIKINLGGAGRKFTYWLNPIGSG